MLTVQACFGALSSALCKTIYISRMEGRNANGLREKILGERCKQEPYRASTSFCASVDAILIIQKSFLNTRRAK